MFCKGPEYCTCAKYAQIFPIKLSNPRSENKKFLAAKGAAQGGLIFGESHTYANVIFVQLLRYEYFAFFLKSPFSPIVKMTSERKQSVHTLVMT